jgi:hypothetical protein
MIMYYTFHSVVEFKFLAYVLNVNTFCYAYHFICKCCVCHMYITIVLFAVFNGRQFPTMLRRRVHVAAQGRERETSGFQGIQCGMFINYRTYCMTTYSYAYNPFSVSNRINKCYHKLTVSLSLNVVSCIIIRDAVYFALYSYRI